MLRWLFLFFVLCPVLAGMAQTAAPAGRDSFSVVFTGDVLLDRGVRQQITMHGIDALFDAGIDSLFREADAVVGNLECPATTRRTPAQKLYIFRAEPEWLADLRRHGFTHLNMANNHTVDQGRGGLADTRRNVAQAGMVAVGAGADMAQAASPVLLHAPHEGSPLPRVWLLASNRLQLEHFAYLPREESVSQEPFDSLVARVARLREADARAVIVVSLHWGWEHRLKPLPQQRAEAHRLVDAGASLLVCHHTHTLQTIEDYNGCRIYYGIGNFIFDQSKPINTEACVVRMTVTPQGLDVQTLPIHIHRCRPQLNPHPSAALKKCDKK